MMLYLDDDIASVLLTQILRQAGHDVRIPAEAGLAGHRDADHLRFCIREGRTCISRNYADFEALHLLIQDSGGHHPGILIVRRDNSPRRNLKPRDIVKAIANMLSAGAVVADQYLPLNSWK
jgi:hypothetical protein